LDFRSGIAFDDSLRLCLASSVCPARPRIPSSFWLVVSFGRCIFKLNSNSVGHLLQAALGGFAAGFEVLQLSDQVFRFSVSSKAVGFHIYNSKCIDRVKFRAFFNLWNRGSPNWIHEFKKFIGEENASWLTVRGKKSLSYADIVKLPLTGANAVPICNKKKFSGGVEHLARIRISAFNRLVSPIRRAGPPRIPKFKPAPMIVPRRGDSSWVLYLDLNGDVHGGGLRGRSNFQNSNSNWTRPRNLQWRPIRKRGPAGPLGPPAFRCHFCKVRGHLELFCPSKKSSFGFPLTSFPAFESRASLVGKLKFLDHSSWFRFPVEPLIDGPPSYSCFEEFARVVLLKKYESTPLQSLTLSLGVTSSKPQTAPSSLVGWRSSLPSPMAYRRVDPEPFLPPGFSASVVLHREVMARSVTRRLPPMHEDWAIVNIQPLPEHEVIFPAVRDVVREYLI
jgi:hypothetical protein